MDGFVVNRELGFVGISKENEQANLAKLMLKIEQRKKDKALKNRKDETNNESANVKNNNEKTVDPLIVSPDTLPDRGAAAVAVEQKKKRKRKRNDSSSDEDALPAVRTDETGVVAPGEGFTILGTDHFEKKAKVKRVLPHWLAKPSVVSGDLQQLTTTVDGIAGIEADLVQRLKDNGITHFFPIQCLVIPWLLSGIDKPTQFWPRDVCVSAPTGSGKTLAYVIPIVQALRNRLVPQVRALVVLPVQDLAVQVAKVFETYCDGTDLKVALVTGNKNFAEEQQQVIRTSIVSGTHSIVDIVVTTTGRIVDHLQSTAGFSLRHLRFLVMDEADRMMEAVKHDWLHHLNKHLAAVGCGSGSSTQRHLTVAALQSQPPPPQKLLFSATLSQDPEKLQQLGLFQPRLFTAVVEGGAGAGAGTDPEGRGDFVGKYTTPAELTETVCTVTQSNKPCVLYHLMAVRGWRNVLCFADSQAQAHTLAVLMRHLGAGRFSVAEVSAMHGRQEREEVMAKFAEGKIDIVVCTDNLARGIDLPTVDYVVSYNAPKFIKNYIHRIGRTARAGRPGTAVTLVQSKQRRRFSQMVAGAGKTELPEMAVTDEDVDGHADHFKKALEAMRTEIKKEEDAAIDKSKGDKRSRKPKRHKKKRANKNIGSNIVKPDQKTSS